MAATAWPAAALQGKLLRRWRATAAAPGVDAHPNDAQAEEATGVGLPRLVRDEFDAFLECGILARSFAFGASTPWNRMRCSRGRGAMQPGAA